MNLKIFYTYSKDRIYVVKIFGGVYTGLFNFLINKLL